MEGPVVSLDPQQVTTQAEKLLLSQIVEPLLTKNSSTGLPEPAAAERFEVSKDGRTFTFHLRKSLRWSNGAPVTARDFEFGLRKFITGGRGKWFADIVKVIQGAEEYIDGALMDPSQLGIVAKDDYTLTIKMSHRSAYALDLFTTPVAIPLNKDVIDRLGSTWAKPKNWVGNGPFVPVRISPRFVRLEKNPHYWNRNVIQIQAVVAYTVGSALEGTDMFLARKVDQFGYRDFTVPVNRLRKLADRKELVYQPDLRTYFVRVNGSRAPVSQLKMRQAIAMSIDRKLLVDSIAIEKEALAYSLVPNGVKKYESPRAYLMNIPGALKILRDLGYCTKGTSATNCKEIPRLTLLHRDHPKHRKIAVTLKVLWKKGLGLRRINLQAKRDEEFYRAIQRGKYTLALDDLAVTADQPFDLLSAFRSDEASSGGYSEAKYDSLIRAALSESDWAKALELFRQTESALLRDAWVIPLMHGTVPVLVSPRVGGYTPNVYDLHPFTTIRLQ